MQPTMPEAQPSNSITALLPRGPGHQFVVYADACSGVPGALHERNFAAINAVVRRLSPEPGFILFPGDEVIGLTADPEQLRAQWRHWLDQEMNWLDRRSIPIWHTTGNHTAYDEMSEGVFREVLGLPRNGPPGQEGLSYWVRRGDLLMIFVHTLWSGLGGEGHVETDWLKDVLQQHRDARHKLVIGHHPVHPVNGFSGPYQREIGPEHATAFWEILVEAQVSAYICSHILAFDVQLRRGVLQICTAGAGTAHRMPEGVEYLHCVQAALDEHGLRCQVLDMAGLVRERFEWPLTLLSADRCRALPAGESPALHTGKLDSGRFLQFHLAGQAAPAGNCTAQTLFCAFSPGLMAPLWVGLQGPEQVLTAIIGWAPGRSPHYWHGPGPTPGASFDLQLVIHPDLGPGGMIYRYGAQEPWSSLTAASAIGPERLDWPERWSVGHARGGREDRPFLGTQLIVSVGIG